jgi:hypothetical protein
MIERMLAVIKLASLLISFVMLMAWWAHPFVDIPLASDNSGNKLAHLSVPVAPASLAHNFTLQSNGKTAYYRNASDALGFSDSILPLASLRIAPPRLETDAPKPTLTAQEDITKRYVNPRKLGKLAKVARYLWSRRFFFLGGALWDFLTQSSHLLSLTSLCMSECSLTA